MVDFLKQKVKEISSTFDVEIINQECDKDHIHIIFKAKPTLNIPIYLNALKTMYVFS
jgi:putative transposase